MPAVTSGKVLITGANGFIGAWTVKAFLDAGFAVRGAVRDESKTTHLSKVLSSYGDKLEFAAVPDITKVWPSSILSLSRRLSLTILDTSSGTRIR